MTPLSFFILLSVIALVCSIVILVLSTIIVMDDSSWTIPTVFSAIIVIFSFIGLFISTNQTVLPTEEDILTKKAVYVENLHIQNNDTIKTYQIQWVKKND